MRFYTSDLHLGHANIIGYCGRPFGGAEAMRDAIFGAWRAAVAPGDEVWVLGDVALGPAWLEELAALAALPGRKVLVPGNHDRCRGGRRDAGRWVAPYAAAFDRVARGVEPIEIGGSPALACHFPYREGPQGPGGRGDKYAVHRPRDDGLPLLCGHVHEAWKVQGRQVNVGVDVWGFRPVPEGEILAALRGARDVPAAPAP